MPKSPSSYSLVIQTMSALSLAAAHPFDRLVESGRRLNGVLDRANREAVAIWAQALGLVKAQLRPGGVDQEVVLDRPVGALPAPTGRLDRDVGRGTGSIALRVDLPRGCLYELDPVPLVDRRQQEGDL
jgi:hypothetical protein